MLKQQKFHLPIRRKVSQLAANMPSLTEIAGAVLAGAIRLEAYTASNGLPSTTFENDTLGSLPDELEEARKSLIDATQDLKRLALGPVGMLLETLFTVGWRSKHCFFWLRSPPY